MSEPVSSPPASGSALPTSFAPGTGPVMLVQGPVFIGFVFKVLLQGVILVQGYLYFSRYSSTDRRLIKAVVAALIFADQLNIILNAAYLFDAFVIHFGNQDHLVKINWLFATDPIINGFTACTAQLFFAWRINVLTKNKWIVGLVSFFAVTSCCGALGCGIGSIMLGSFLEFPKLTAVLIIWLGAAVIADVLIAVTLSWYLVWPAFCQRDE
ncbi:hypothetical protein HGRIS_014039 [Hohenbuehelia grisea]|uniref:Uncharacterized protein n=1 Tax=Hohenbuehelia grisea TaxID=104357 RepID=A0ABR3JSC6_9AGAR